MFLFPSGQWDAGWPSLPHLKHFLSSVNFHHKSSCLCLGPYYPPFEQMKLPQKWVGSLFLTCYTCIGSVGWPGGSWVTDHHLYWCRFKYQCLSSFDSYCYDWGKFRMGNIPLHLPVSLFSPPSLWPWFSYYITLQHGTGVLGVVGLRQYLTQHQYWCWIAHTVAPFSKCSD